MYNIMNFKRNILDTWKPVDFREKINIYLIISLTNMKPHHCLPFIKIFTFTSTTLYICYRKCQNTINSGLSDSSFIRRNKKPVCLIYLDVKISPPPHHVMVTRLAN